MEENTVPSTKYQVVALSSLDPTGSDTQNEPWLLYPDALKAAQEFKGQGKAFRVHVAGPREMEALAALRDLGALL